MADNAPTHNESQSKIDTARAHMARIWNYWLGGRDNYPIDREVGDQIRQFHPDIGAYARADRFLDALPSGSYLVLSHTITSPAMPDVDAAVAF